MDDRLFVDPSSFGVTNQAPKQDGILGVETEDDLEILKFVVEYLQILGKKMDQAIRESSATDQEYLEKTKVLVLLETREGREYLIISSLLGMIAKTPEYAKVLVPFMENDALFVELLGSIDIRLDPQTQSLKIDMNDSIIEKRKSNLIVP
jgi:hypothetical protein